MNITRYLQLTFCIVMIFSISSCSKKKLTEKKSAENKKIVFFTQIVDINTIQVFNKAMSVFMKKNPYITVTMLNVSHMHNIEKLVSMSAGGSMPDVVFIGTNLIPALCSKGVFHDLEPFLQKDKELKIDDFFPSTIQSYKYKNKLYALPNDIAAGAVYYNRDIFDKEKVPYPKEGWTVKDLLEISKKLTKDSDGDGRIDQYALADYTIWIPFIILNNGQIVDNLDNPKKCTINSAECVEAIQFVSDLGNKHKLMPSYENFVQQGGGRELFPIGKIAMSFDGVWMIPAYSKIKKFKWNITSYPKWKRSANFADGSGYAISSVTKNPESAWRFVKFMAGIEGQKILISAGFNTPCLKSKEIRKLFLSEPKGINKKPFLDSIQDAVKAPVTPKSSEMMALMWRNLEKIFIGKEKDVKKICDKITVEVNKLFQ